MYRIFFFLNTWKWITSSIILLKNDVSSNVSCLTSLVQWLVVSREISVYLKEDSDTILWKVQGIAFIGLESRIYRSQRPLVETKAKYGHGRSSKIIRTCDMEPWVVVFLPYRCLVKYNNLHINKPNTCFCLDIAWCQKAGNLRHNIMALLVLDRVTIVSNVST